MLTIAVYGDFAKKEIKVKTFKTGTTEQFRFQNTLREAGYDCELFHVDEEAKADCVSYE